MYHIRCFQTRIATPKPKTQLNKQKKNQYKHVRNDIIPNVWQEAYQRESEQEKNHTGTDIILHERMTHV